LLWLILLLTCGLPIGWALGVAIAHPRAVVDGFTHARLMDLFLRTTLYGVSAAIGAVAIGLVPAVAIGRRTTRLARALWLVVPLPLLLPSIVIQYGWQEALHIAHIETVPQSRGDIVRCIFILAAWLWPIPAMLIGLSLRRIDASLLEQASLDGGLRRLLVRRAITPALAAGAICMMLALQEFSVFEPTGISVLATEVRMIFETGLLSSADNPIASLNGGVGSTGNVDLGRRSALALSAGVPVMALTMVLFLVAWRLWLRGRLDETIELAPPPMRLNVSGAWTVGAWVMMVLTIGVPLAAMAHGLDRPFHPWRIYVGEKPHFNSSMEMAAVTGAIGMLIALLAAIRVPRGAMALAVASFLIGGQFQAIALLRVFNRKFFGSDILVTLFLDSNIAPVIAYVGRFAWIALLAGAALHGGAWRAYREMASVDGATPARTVAHVLIGMGWPILLLAGLLMAALALVEVPATVLLVPRSIVPLIMGWVHMQRYGPMLETSLMLAGTVLAVGWMVVALFVLSRKRLRGSALAMVAVMAILSINGCGKSSAQPDEVWCSAGRAPGEVVYPRAITRAPDGSFFIVDRAARIQHLSAAGKPMGEWQMWEYARGKPVGLTVAPDGNLWVPDTHYHRVIVFSPDGRELLRFGTRGAGPKEFDLPTDIAFDASGNVYVSEYGDNNRIQVFDKDLNFIRMFGTQGDGDG
jgi:ABC-type Fe3+ transport system permease subunit